MCMELVLIGLQALVNLVEPSEVKHRINRWSCEVSFGKISVVIYGKLYFCMLH